MSSTLSFLVSELTSLSKETKRHPDVKEAADRALAALKHDPDAAFTDLETASSSGNADHAVLLMPVVLGCATRNAKVISVAVTALQRLTGIKGAVTGAAVPVILQTLRSVLSQGVEIQLKTLQTLVSLMTNCKGIHGAILSETLLISFKLQESKIGVVSSTAAATLRQLVMFVYEGLDEEDARSAADDGMGKDKVSLQLTQDSEADDKIEVQLGPSAYDAYRVFQDVLTLVSGTEQPSFLKLQSVPKTFGLELVESVLSEFSNVFRKHPELLHLLKTNLTPLLIRLLAEQPVFSITLRAMRVSYLLIKKFYNVLDREARIFLTIFIRIILPQDSSTSAPLLANSNGKASSADDVMRAVSTFAQTAWLRVLSLEILRGLCSDFDLLRKIHGQSSQDGRDRVSAPSSPDNERPALEQRSNSSNKESMLSDLISALNRMASERPAALGSGSAVLSGVAVESGAGEYSVAGVVDGIVGMAHQAASSVGVTPTGQPGILSTSLASVKVQLIDQLDKAEAPAIPDTYTALLSLQCIVAVSDGFASNTLPAYTTLMAHRMPVEPGQNLTSPPALDLASCPPEPAYDALRTVQDMADASWPALLAILSFFLTVNVDHDLFTYSLNAFQNFATVCGVLGLETPRDAFLTNLCKFAVPATVVAAMVSTESAASSRQQPVSLLSVGTEALGLTASSQAQTMTLSTRNLLCLKSLLGVAQALAGAMGSTWIQIFDTMQNVEYVLQASGLRSQSRKRHTSSAYSSAGPVTHQSPSKVMNTAGGHGHGASNQSASSDISAEKIQRCMPTEADEDAARQRISRFFEISRHLDQKALLWFVSSLCRLDEQMISYDKSPLQNAGSGDVSDLKRNGPNLIRTLRSGEKSFAIAKLGEVFTHKVSQLVCQLPDDVWDAILNHLLWVQQCQSASSTVRTQAASVFDNAILSAVDEISSSNNLDWQLVVHKHTIHALSKQATPLANETTSDISIRKAALEALFRILEGQGHSLQYGWPTIFEMLQSAIPPTSIASSSPNVDSESVTANKGGYLVKIAFSSLQIACSDFLAGFSEEELELCISTLSAFSRQTEDINIALTAGGLFWQLSDHLQTKRLKTADGGQPYLDLWIRLMKELLVICSDDRQEARDGAVQTLWRSFELYGATLDTKACEQCFWQVIFPLMHNIDKGIASAASKASAAAAEEAVLIRKQWDDSKILILVSASSVFIEALTHQLTDETTFDKVCTALIDYLRRSILEDSQAVATSALKCLDRVFSTSWPEDQHDNFAILFSRTWAACDAIGEAIGSALSSGYAQVTLESYVKLLDTLQKQKALAFKDEQLLRLLQILKSVTLYNQSPEYRPDQDVLSPLQKLVCSTVDAIPLTSTRVACAVLEDYAEYMTLAYQSMNQTAQAKATSSDGNRHRMTFIALTKHSTSRLFRLCQQFRTEPAIYDRAVQQVLKAYAIPLRLKYDCPPSSKYDSDAPLWKTATSHFLQILCILVDSLQHLKDNLADITVANTWRRLVDVLQASLMVRSYDNHDFTLEESQIEEDFDMMVLDTIESQLLPILDGPSVPDDAILSLSQSLLLASKLYDLSSTVPGHAGSNGKDRRSKPPRQNGRPPKDGRYLGSTMADTEVPRERYAKRCLSALFLMCSRGASSEQALPSIGTKPTDRLARLVFPLLMDRCSTALEQYLANASIRGQIPFSRIREEEVLLILTHCSELVIVRGIAVPPQPEIDNGSNHSSNMNQLVQSSKRAHLFILYPTLLALLSLGEDSNRLPLSASTEYSQNAGSAATRSRTQLARQCLDVLGKEFIFSQ